MTDDTKKQKKEWPQQQKKIFVIQEINKTHKDLFEKKTPVGRFSRFS